MTDDNNRGIELVNVTYSLQGTSTNKNGYYELIVEGQDTIELTFSMLGYTTVKQRLIKPKEVVNINVQMDRERMAGGGQRTRYPTPDRYL